MKYKTMLGILGVCFTVFGIGIYGSFEIASFVMLCYSIGMIFLLLELDTRIEGQ